MKMRLKSLLTLLSVGIVIALVVAVAVIVWRGAWGPTDRFDRPDAIDLGGPAVRGPGTTAEDYRFDAPQSHANLTVVLIHGPETLPNFACLTLQDALTQNKVVVHETDEVNELSVENVSDETVFIQSGEIVKGGKQDRTIESDLIVPSRSGRVPLRAFCVEQGRWAQRSGESQSRFSSSDGLLNTKGLKAAAAYKKSQPEVWENVARTQRRLAENVGEDVQSPTSRSSLQLTLENQKVRDAAEEYVRALSSAPDGKEDVIGVAMIVNGKVAWADVYGSKALFQKLWPKLLRAAALEALADRDAASPGAAGTEEVRAWLAAAEQGRASGQDLTSRVHLVLKDAADELLLETCDRQQNNAVVHRSFLAK